MNMDNRSFKKTVAPVKEARYHIYLAIGFFIVGTCIGFKQPDRYGESFDYLAGLAGFLKDSHPLIIILILFLKNALASFIALWSGALLGIIPAVTAVQNGALVGVVFLWKGSFSTVLLNILPHGIFELPAFFIACGLGLWRGTWIFRKNKDETYKDRARKGYRVYCRLVIPLLFFAAIVEGLRIAQIR
jgi:stage II sporulation protein M